MITIFAIPKPFRGHIGMIQRNAIRSWTLLTPKCEIFLFGNDEGVAEVSAEFGLRHIPDVACNEYGTPLLNDAFEKASELASNELLCYVNSDIILMDDFMDAITRVAAVKKRFLLIGRHWKMDINQPLDFNSGWQSRLRESVKSRGHIETGWAMDYFVYRRQESFDMPPLAVGRPRWDNWLVYKARFFHLPVIDISEVVMAVHQNHDYSHVPKGSGFSFDGPEADANHETLIAHGEDKIYGFLDATHKLRPGGLRTVMGFDYLKRYLETVPTLHPKLSLLFFPLRLIITVTRPARIWLRKESKK